jgi:hypothetical protein
MKKDTDENPTVPLWLMFGFGAVVLIALAVSLTWFFVHHGSFNPLH